MNGAADARPRGDAPRAVVIGGGATGCGVARDLVLRGFHVTLVEEGDLGSGTSGRFHGMLQSGARYAVTDPAYAAECMRERTIVADLVPHAVEPVGGSFVALDEDPAGYADDFAAGCRAAGIPSEELDPARVMREEPALSRRIRRAFSVPDATINPWWLVNALADDVRKHGGRILARHRATAIDRAGGKVAGVRVEGAGGAQRLDVDVIVNAAGGWSDRVARLAGQAVALELTKGSILVLAVRPVGRIVNRCRYPASHDIVVPSGNVNLFGTTSEPVDDPDVATVRPAEIQELLDGATPLMPGIREARVIRAWAGVRPLVKPPGWPAGKAVPRRHTVIDHGQMGLTGFITVCGGSLSTHRFMAEEAVDRACGILGWNAACTTATAAIETGSRDFWRPMRARPKGESVAALCPCEGVRHGDVRGAIEAGHVSLGDLRRRTRIGLGPCQGAICGVRAADLVAASGHHADVVADLAAFWRERRKGIASVAWGEQARQLLLGEHVHARLLGVDEGKPRPDGAARP